MTIDLVQADVFQVVIGCPASDNQPDLDRFEADLMTTAGYLRQALKDRPAGSPVAVELFGGLSVGDRSCERPERGA